MHNTKKIAHSKIIKKGIANCQLWYIGNTKMKSRFRD